MRIQGMKKYLKKGGLIVADIQGFSNYLPVSLKIYAT
ncbi:MAG: hypothetical protein JWQ63_2314 [Mucilaginibacter sp.]|nr:hypothetical protein [Mucilaginibacter sp.]